jgi:PAS domain S-box-containing protein
MDMGRDGSSVAAMPHELYLQLALDSLPALTWYATPDGLVEYHNRRWTAYTGMSLEASLGSKWMAAVHPDDRKTIESRFSAATPGADFELELRLRRHDGAYRWFLVRAGHLLDGAGAVVRRFGVSLDVEDQKQSDAARSRTESYLVDAQRLSKTGSFVVNFVTKEHLWSEETYRIYEYEPGITPTADHVLDRVHPEDRAYLKTNFDRRHLREPLDLNYRLLFPDGRIKYIHVIGRPLENKSPGVTYMGALMDVTEVRLAEDALHQVHAALTHATRVITLGELAASIAHEVNQPLAGIVMNGEACMRWLNRDVPDLDEVRSNVRQIIADGERAAQVIRRLRALARKSDPEYVALNINDVVVETIPLVQREIAQQRVTLKLDLSAEVPDVSGDKVQLQQVVINLITNGLQAMAGDRAHGAVLEISSRLLSNGRVSLSIVDQGTGIAPDAIGELFNPFFTTKPDGMGMGLSICRSIVEAHGGEIQASNNLTAGATITITLPRHGRNGRP